MRTIKSVLLIVIAVAVMLVMAANMAKVELHLLPSALAADGWSVTAPLAGVIVVSVLAGIVLGLILGSIGEQNFAQGMQMVHYDLVTYFSRPIGAILIVLGTLTLLSSAYRAFATSQKSV